MHCLKGSNTTATKSVENLSTRLWQLKAAAQLLEGVVDPQGRTTGGVQDVHFKADVMAESLEGGRWIAHWTEIADRQAPLGSLAELDNWLVAPGTDLVTNAVWLYREHGTIGTPAHRAARRATLNLEEYPATVQPAVPPGSQFEEANWRAPAPMPAPAVQGPDSIVVLRAEWVTGQQATRAAGAAPAALGLAAPADADEDESAVDLGEESELELDEEYEDN